MDQHGSLSVEPARVRSVSIEEFVELVEGVLERSGLDAEDNFFEAGGSSLSAISLALDIERATGQELSMSALCDAATIRDMHGLLGREQRLSSSRLVVLRKGTGSRRMFFVHGIGGSTFELRDLALELRSDLTVYGIQAIGLDGGEPLATIEAMADRYVDEITALDPDGPYLLVGYSSGGLTAFEMARRLIRRGLEVRFLGMVASYPPRSGSPWHAVRDTARILRMASRRRRACLDRMRWNLVTDAQRVVGLVPKRGLIDPLFPEAVRRVTLVAREAARHYRPSRCECEATFFESEIPLNTIAPNPERVWRPLVRRLTVEVVPGDHHTMVQGCAASVLAAAINRHLATALT